MPYKTYSKIFVCLHDEGGPLENLGAGLQHTIFRTTQGRDLDGQLTDRMHIHDFAVIWDSDHDERIVAILEELHLAGLLWPVVFASEHKGRLVLILQAGIDVGSDYCERVKGVCSANLNDTWEIGLRFYKRARLGEFYPTFETLPNVRPEIVSALWNMDSRWKLGLRNKPRFELRSVWEDIGPDGLLT